MVFWKNYLASVGPNFTQTVHECLTSSNIQFERQNNRISAVSQGNEIIDIDDWFHKFVLNKYLHTATVIVSQIDSHTKPETSHLTSKRDH